MNCQCVDDHPFVMFGTLLGDNCGGLTGWGFVFMFGMILLIGLVAGPGLCWLTDRM